MVGEELPPIAMISTTTTTMKASPTTTTTAATRRAPNRERLEGGTGIKLPVGRQPVLDLAREAMAVTLACATALTPERTRGNRRVARRPCRQLAEVHSTSKVEDEL